MYEAQLWVLVLTMVGCNLTRMRTLEQIRLQTR